MKQLATLLLLTVSAVCSSQTTVNLQGTEFVADTLEHYYFGPGMTHTHLRLTAPSRTIHVYAATLDKGDISYKDNASVRVEIGNDQCRTAERMTDMAARKSSPTRRYLAGINGDFFITSAFAAQHEFGNQILGYPNMTCVIDGCLAAPDMIDIVSRENALIISADNMWIDATDLTYKVISNNGEQQAKAKALNYPRRDNEMMVYNSYMGATTNTSPGGRELALVPADGAKWNINQSIKFIAQGDWTTSGNTAIPEGGIVISCGPDYANEYIDGIRDGDIVKLKIILKLPAFENLKPKDVKHIVGGDVRILNCGEVTTEAIRWINTPTARYARSLVGYSQDRSKLVVAAVDGNSQSSGVSYFEGADLMRALGCYDALDMDGGGSTAMWGLHSGMLNHPRDGSERAIGNALFFTLDAPEDPAVASIRFADPAMVLPLFGTYTPRIYGYNKYGQLVDTDIQDCALSTIKEGVLVDGNTVTATTAGSFCLVASKEGMEARIAVDVRDNIAVVPERASILTDAVRSVPVRLQADVRGSLMPVSTAAFEWTEDNPGIISFDSANGIVKGLSEGTVRLTGRNAGSGMEINVDVDVEIASGPLMPLTPAIGGDGWSISRSGIAPDASAVTDASGTTLIEFDVTSRRASHIVLSNELRAYSLPDGFSMHVDPQGASLKGMTFKFKTANDKAIHSINAGALTSESDVSFDLSSEVDLSDPAVYPLTFVSLRLDPDKGADGGDHYSIKLKDIGFTYSNHSSGVGNIAIPSAQHRLQLRNTGSMLEAPAGVSMLTVYNLSGVVAAHSEGNSVELPEAGVYIVRGITAAGPVSAKVVVKR